VCEAIQKKAIQGRGQQTCRWTKHHKSDTEITGETQTKNAWQTTPVAKGKGWKKKKARSPGKKRTPWLGGRNK